MKFVFVEAVDEVLDAALESVQKPKKVIAPRKKSSPKKAKKDAKTAAR